MHALRLLERERPPQCVQAGCLPCAPQTGAPAQSATACPARSAYCISHVCIWSALADTVPCPCASCLARSGLRSRLASSGPGGVTPAGRRYDCVGLGMPTGFQLHLSSTSGAGQHHRGSGLVSLCVPSTQGKPATRHRPCIQRSLCRLAGIARGSQVWTLEWSHAIDRANLRPRSITAPEHCSRGLRSASLGVAGFFANSTAKGPGSKVRRTSEPHACNTRQTIDVMGGVCVHHSSTILTGFLVCAVRRAFAISFCTSSLRTEMESKHCLEKILGPNENGPVKYAGQGDW